MSNFHLLRYSFAGQEGAIYLNLDCVKTLYVYPNAPGVASETIVVQWRDGGNATYDVTAEELRKLLSAIDY